METGKCNKIILADDHILLRDALADFITGFSGFTVVATAANGYEVIEAIDKCGQPDILLLDLNMPEMDGYETAKRIANLYPNIKTVILTMQDSEVALVRLLQIGVSGLLKKDIHPDELNRALLAIVAGENYYSHETAIRIANLLRKKTDHNLSLADLVLNEQEIKFLKLVTTDMTYPEIARVMGLNLRHIETYRQTLFAKLKVDSRVGLALYAAKNGIINS
jgi:two-component system, NarL family, invasion response regulator UvrY